MNANETEGRKNHQRRPVRSRTDRHWWAWLRLVLLGMALAGVTGTVMVLPILPTDQVVLEAGEVAPQDIHAPHSITYESSLLRAEEQERAASRVEPVYTPPDPAKARQQFDRALTVLEYLEVVRADTAATSSQKRSWVLAVPELVEFPSEAIAILLALPDESWDRVRWETLDVIDQAMRRDIRQGYLEEIRAEVPALVGLDLSEEEAAVTVVLVQRFLVPNSFLDPDATEAARAQSHAKVGPVLRTFEVGQVIVREGEIVTALDIEVLDQLGLRQSQVKWTDFVRAGGLALSGTLLLFLYLARFQSDTIWDGRQLLLLVLLLSFFVLIAGIMTPSGIVLRYLSLAPALAMLASAALGPQAGVASAIFLGAAAGIIDDGSLEMLIYVSLGGVIAALTLGRVERISALFRAGLFAALAHLVVVLLFRVSQELEQPIDWVIPALAGLANGGIAASLALGGLFLIGPLFDVVTTMRLVELSRPDQPLLRRLLREAPATYHHSLMVANLAEQAAERIKADPLLARVGAYYHDIGKIARPYFFTENQVEGVNPHERLDPRTSAEVIISHVKDGIDLARRHHLPRRVRDFIPEHHGTTWVSFLYNKAVQLAGDAALVDENDFRHLGPKPRSKEAALVMLADGCEAAVRAMRPTSAEEVAEIVDRVITERVADEQLSECDLTLHDLQVVRDAFTSALKGVFHPRIQYPQSERATDA